MSPSEPPEPREPVESISAVTFAVRDMRASYTFYAALGFARVYGGVDATFTSLRAGAGFVNLQCDPDYEPGRRVWGRAIFWVDDVDAMYERALVAGIAPETAPVDAPWGERFFHVRDPDGHELSFARPVAVA